MIENFLVILSLVLMLGYPVMSSFFVYICFKNKRWETYGVFAILAFLLFATGLSGLFVLAYEESTTNFINNLLS